MGQPFLLVALIGCRNVDLGGDDSSHDAPSTPLLRTPPPWPCRTPDRSNRRATTAVDDDWDGTPNCLDPDCPSLCERGAPTTAGRLLLRPSRARPSDHLIGTATRTAGTRRPPTQRQAVVAVVDGCSGQSGSYTLVIDELATLETGNSGIDDDDDLLLGRADIERAGHSSLWRRRGLRQRLRRRGAFVIDCLDTDCDLARSCLEVCDDGVDNDGNGPIDRVDSDCVGDPGAPRMPAGCPGGNAVKARLDHGRSTRRRHAVVHPPQRVFGSGVLGHGTHARQLHPRLQLRHRAGTAHGCGGAELACNDDGPQNLQSALTYAMLGGETVVVVVVVVDGYGGTGGEFVLTVRSATRHRFVRHAILRVGGAMARIDRSLAQGWFDELSDPSDATVVIKDRGTSEALLDRLGLDDVDDDDDDDGGQTIMMDGRAAMAGWDDHNDDVDTDVKVAEEALPQLAWRGSADSQHTFASEGDPTFSSEGVQTATSRSAPYADWTPMAPLQHHVLPPNNSFQETTLPIMMFLIGLMLFGLAAFIAIAAVVLTL